MQKTKKSGGKDALYQAARAAIRAGSPLAGLALDWAQAHPEEVKGGLRAVGRGVPLWGGAQDEAFAVADATFGGDRSKSWGERWNSAVEEQRAYDAAFDKEHPFASAALQTAGGFILPGGAALRAGTLVPKAFRTANNLAGKSLLNQAVDGAYLGAFTSFADGFANGAGSVESRLENANRFLRRGIQAGGVVPFVSRGLGKATGRIDPRAAAPAEQWATGILGNIDPNGPVGGLVPLPLLEGPPPRRPAPR